jgi:hypothetical protein
MLSMLIDPMNLKGFMNHYGFQLMHMVHNKKNEPSLSLNKPLIVDIRWNLSLIKIKVMWDQVMYAMIIARLNFGAMNQFSLDLISFLIIGLK